MCMCCVCPLVGGSLTGAVFNPALAFSIQFPCSGNTFLEYSLVYCLGPILGTAHLQSKDPSDPGFSCNHSALSILMEFVVHYKVFAREHWDLRIMSTWIFSKLHLFVFVCCCVNISSVSTYLGQYMMMRCVHWLNSLAVLMFCQEMCILYIVSALSCTCRCGHFCAALRQTHPTVVWEKCLWQGRGLSCHQG